MQAAENCLKKEICVYFSSSSQKNIFLKKLDISSTVVQKPLVAKKHKDKKANNFQYHILEKPLGEKAAPNPKFLRYFLRNLFSAWVWTF